MKFFLMAAACCLVACASNFSLRGSEVQYSDRGLGKNQPVAAASAYATAKNADREGYDAETRAKCVEALTGVLRDRPDLAPYISPAAQCGGNGGWGYGYGGGVPYAPFPSMESRGGPWGQVFLDGAGAPSARELRPHLVVLFNGSHSQPVRVFMDGRLLAPVIRPQGEAWLYLPYASLERPTIAANPQEECHVFDMTWLSPATGGSFHRGSKRACFRPRDGGSHFTLHPSP